MTFVLTTWKFLRDCSSVHVVAPDESASKRIGVPLLWQETQRVWPSRLARKMGCTLVLKNSKSKADAAGELGSWPSSLVVAGCRVSNAATSNTKKTTRINPPAFERVLIKRLQLDDGSAICARVAILASWPLP